MFSRSKNIYIGGHASFIHNENSFNYGSTVDRLDEEIFTESTEGIRLLLPHVVTAAIHNSRHRFDAPTCHPETRLAIQKDLLGWAEQQLDNLDELVTWLYGPAGAGKSAIAQTIAQKLHIRGQLSASFFFSRDSGGDGRGEETNLIATLAHQLSQNIPDTKPHIAAAIRDNPLIFDLSLYDQVDALIVAPLLTASTTTPERPWVMVVDGLDECRKEYDAQRIIVDALIFALHRIPQRNHKLFITSRPEDNIVAIFSNYGGRLVRRMELNNKWNPDDDIRTFLNAGFADIRRCHFYFQSHRVDTSRRMWPSIEIIGTLVRRSSGQFIYASVVLKYIRSEEYYDPVARLETIIELRNTEDQPYAELDALYEYIFSQIRHTEIDRILTVLLLDRDYSDLVEFEDESEPFSAFLSAFMGVHIDEIKFWLRPLASVLSFKGKPEDDSRKIHYMHASLLDFLSNQSRSKIFCIQTSSIVAGIVRRAVELLVDGTALKIPYFMTPLISILSHYESKLPSDEIHHLVSNFSVLDNVIYKIDPDFIEAGHSALAITRHLEWVLKQSENENTSYYQKPAAQIQSWLISQFEHLYFDALDHTGQIDVWPFFTCPLRSDASTAQISEDLYAALEICESSLGSYGHYVRETTPSLSRQTAVLCSLMPDLADQPESWLYRTDLLGRYAMTEERYGLALQRVACYVLQLPKHVLLEILNGSNSGEDIVETGAFHLLRDVLSRLLISAPPTTNLYFFMGLLYPVMRRLGVDNQDILTYICEVPKRFPFLNDRTSSEYIQARAAMEETCDTLKFQISFHELVEMVQKELVPYQHFV